ncbi:hypothetical protein M0811_03970 [Anaeramoeba ignava]|uniref:Uncharacterized protein n=1 Tax=Anaeramoeba ignava TaxID=1746090 RepID=A0A9Q0RG36_ANAIG|nr:hypothetical protein M0811_03970 [Anaeramoeba ignava]
MSEKKTKEKTTEKEKKTKEKKTKGKDEQMKQLLLNGFQELDRESIKKWKKVNQNTTKLSQKAEQIDGLVFQLSDLAETQYDSWIRLYRQFLTLSDMMKEFEQCYHLLDLITQKYTNLKEKLPNFAQNHYEQELIKTKNYYQRGTAQLKENQLVELSNFEYSLKRRALLRQNLYRESISQSTPIKQKPKNSDESKIKKDSKEN